MSRILIAEDEARIASFVEKGLRAAGFAVTVTAPRPIPCVGWKGEPTTTCPSRSASMSCLHGCGCA